MKDSSKIEVSPSHLHSLNAKNRRTLHTPSSEPKIEEFSHSRYSESKIEEHPACSPDLKTCRFQNPDIPRAGRDGAAHGGTAGRGGTGQDGTPTDRSAPRNNRPSYPPDDRRKPSWACFWKHEQRKPYVNRWMNTTSGSPTVYSRFIRGG